MPDMGAPIAGLEFLAPGHYRWTEPNDPLAPLVLFAIHPTNGTVRVSTAGAPDVPWQVLTFIALRARGEREPNAATG